MLGALLMSVWLVVGSAPGVERYHAALAHLPGVTSITANAAGSLWQNPSRPDYYWLSDPVAIGKFCALASALKARGTRIISASVPEDGRSRHLVAPDVLVRIPRRGGSFSPYRPGEWVHPRLSGLLCLQFALHNGADTVVMAGMVGYASGTVPVVDECDGRKGPARGAEYNRDWIGPFVQSCIAALPSVRFVMCDVPRYSVHGPNLSIVTTPEEAASALRAVA